MFPFGIIEQHIFSLFSIDFKIINPFALITITAISRRPSITRMAFEVISRRNCENRKKDND